MSALSLLDCDITKKLLHIDLYDSLVLSVQVECVTSNDSISRLLSALAIRKTTAKRTLHTTIHQYMMLIIRSYTTPILKR